MRTGVAVHDDCPRAFREEDLVTTLLSWLRISVDSELEFLQIFEFALSIN